MTTRRPAPARESAAEREMRDQEVRRANRELAAYFKGLRTEREARAALRTIKAFIRERERQDPQQRAPLPGLRSTTARKTRVKRPYKSSSRSREARSMSVASTAVAPEKSQSE